MQRNLNGVNLPTPPPNGFNAPSPLLLQPIHGTKREPPPAAVDFPRSFDAAIIRDSARPRVRVECRSIAEGEQQVSRLDRLRDI